jgi:carboxylate-amine ligase
MGPRYREPVTPGTRHPPAGIVHPTNFATGPACTTIVHDTGPTRTTRVRAFLAQTCQTLGMEIEFAPSPRSSIGLEWELACVDPVSGELAPAAPEILAKLGEGSDGEFPQVTAELLTNTVELVSGPHARVADSTADLSRMIERVRTVSDPLGVDLMCSGTHPFSQWHQQQVTPDHERYATLIDRTQWWGRQMMIWGVHMHVGIEERAKVLPILNGMLSFFPHFQALSASSPFWAGEATGYASNRALMFQQLPTAGLPPQLGAWANYEELVQDLTHVGVIDDHSELRWDLRPSPKWGTIELRFCDGLASVTEVAAVAALAQCLIEDLSTKLDEGIEVPSMQPWYVRENKWRSARYGMDAIIILDSHGNEQLVTDDLLALLGRLEPVAARLGCLDELMGVDTILKKGASYQRQLAVAAEHDGDLKPVVRSLVRELRDGL